MAAMTAETFCAEPVFQRTDARPASHSTVALRTPGTPWIASVTCRAQLLQFMPLICRCVTKEFYRGREALSNFAINELAEGWNSNSSASAAHSRQHRVPVRPHRIAGHWRRQPCLRQTCEAAGHCETKNQGDSGTALISMWLVSAITAVPAMREFDHGN